MSIYNKIRALLIFAIVVLFISTLTVSNAFIKLSDESEVMYELANSVMWTNIILMAIAGVVIIVGTFLILRSIKPLQSLTEDAQRIAHSDLSGATLHSTSKDEVGQLTNAIEQMKQNLLSSIADIQAISSQLSSTSNNIKHQAEEMSSNSGQSEQAEIINELVGTIGQVSNNVNEMNTLLGESRDSVQQATEEVSRGDGKVGDTVKSIKSLASEMANAASVVSQLKAETTNIGTVLDVIKGIAEQTNLLALNAAIEAARAGEQGRGFAVVADEVRTLAQRTQESTEEIESMIAKLQNGAEEAVNVMTTGHQHTDETMKEATEAGNSLDMIFESVAVINGSMQQISSSVNTQTSLANSMNQNVSYISSISSMAQSNAEQNLAICEELDQLTHNLNTSVSKFKI